MLKGARLLATILLMVCCAACGNKATTATVTTYSNYSSVSTTGGAFAIGGAIQGTPLPLAAKGINATAVSTLAGIPGSAGAVDAGGASAAATSFNIVNGITTDGANLYIADFGNHTIRKYSFSDQTTTTIAGVAGVAGSSDTAFATGSAAAVAATFNGPSGITTDGNGNLYVTDYNNSTIRRIYMRSDGSATVTTIAGLAGTVGSVDDTLIGGVNARFNHPTDITTDGVHLYVTDSNNLTIRKINILPPYGVTTVAGSPGNGGAADGVGANARFKYPARITTDGSYLYVTDFINNTIRRIEPLTGMVTTIVGSPGQTGSNPAGAAVLGQNARFSNINGITTDGTNLYVTDSNNHTIRQISLTAPYTVTTIAGSPGVPGTNAAGATVSGADARFKFPVGITTDGTSLYVTDSNNYTIRKIQ